MVSVVAETRAAALLRTEPGLVRMIELARDRLSVREVWLFGSRARGDARPDSDWDVFLVLPDEASDADLDPVAGWRIGHDAGLVADVVTERASAVFAAKDVINTLAFALPREGLRLE